MKVEQCDRDAFTRGYLIAVANIMHTHGEEVIAADVLRELNEREGILRRLGFDSFDAAPLRKLFRQNTAQAKYAAIREGKS